MQTDCHILRRTLLHVSGVPLCSLVGSNTANVHWPYTSLNGPSYGSFIKLCAKCNFRIPLGKILNEMCCQEFANHKGMCNLVACYRSGMFELCRTSLSLASRSGCPVHGLVYCAVSFVGRFYIQVTIKIFHGRWWYPGTNNILVACV